MPTAHSFALLSHVGIFGWKQLLTTAPPVGDSSGLLALPYLIGLIGGVLATSLAFRTRSIVLPLLGPGFVLAMGILFGSRVPTSLFLQGTVFGGVALAWVVFRHHRYRQLVNSTAFGRRRMLLAGGMLVVVALLAGLLGPDMPGADSHTRVVLSRYVVPPFNVNNQPSPLGGFRQYAQGGHLNDEVLFTVHDLDSTQTVHMRIATMDAYDGLVWGFGVAGDSSAAASADDTFEKYGTTIPPGTSGTPQDVTVTIGHLGGVWMPDLGETTRIAFQGPQAPQLDNDVRYDTATETAAQPDLLEPGDSYVLQALVPPVPSNQRLMGAAAGTAQLAISQVPEVVRTDAQQWAGTATTAWGKVSSIAAHLLQVGKYSNGSSGATAGPTLSLPGHSAGRLTTFFDGGGLVGTQIVGDDEQYAAAMALLANAVGVPARVVLGADVPPSGQVEGKDIHAWIEVLLNGLGWVPMYQTQFMSDNPPSKTPPTQQPRAQSAAPVQPPAVSAVRSPYTSQLPGTGSSATAPNQAAPHGSGVPSWVWGLAQWVLPPLLVLAVVVSMIRGLKRRRRNRRYRAARPSARVAGAWAELIDFERDLGRQVPANATRREQVPFIEGKDVAALATQADASVFGPGEPSADEVDAFWGLVDRAMAAARTGMGRFERWRVAMSLRSLRVNDSGGTL